MSKLFKACFTPRYTIIAVVGLCLLAVGLVAWGLAPALIAGALPLLGLLVCLLPCLLPLFWLRQNKKTSGSESTANRSEQS